MDYCQHTDQHIQQMLDTIGVNRIDDLFAPIPRNQRFTGELSVPLAASEPDLLAEIDALAAKNHSTADLTCFLGCGAYDHFIPTIVDHLALRGEFLTAYTPYQAEASQGTLQAFYEFQTMICELTGMEIANASLYEAASAAAEAVIMARAINNRPRILVSATCHPDLLDTLDTYNTRQQGDVVRIDAAGGVTDTDKLDARLDDQVSAIVIQYPNFFGIVEDVEAQIAAAHNAGALAIVSFDPIAAGILKRPGDLDADIVVGEGQPLGIPLQYGAPYLGLMACRQQYLRKMPGRVVGVAHDANGRRGYCLVLQTREQHIKRERATSNICTNQGLMAMRACVHMSAMGKTGIRKAATLAFQKAHYAAKEIAKLSGFSLRFDKPFFKEFTVQTKKNVHEVLASCRSRGILAGVPLSRWHKDLADCFTVAVTEKRTKKEIDALVSALNAT